MAVWSCCCNVNREMLFMAYSGRHLLVPHFRVISNFLNANHSWHCLTQIVQTVSSLDQVACH